MNGGPTVRQAILIIVLTSLICWPATTQIRGGSPRAEEDVRRFLVEYVESNHAEVDDTRYAVGFVDLNEDGIDEAIVYLLGRYWCGTAGCQTLVLTRSGDSYRPVTRILATRPPIRALRLRAHGWRTLTARVRGAGPSDFEAEFPFDGKSYPMSAAPGYASRLRSNAEGDVVIPASAGDIRNGRVLSGAR
jgi:hypothetical protein